MTTIRTLKRELERLETSRNYLEEKYEETLQQELQENNPGTKVELRKQRESYESELRQVDTEIEQILEDIAKLEEQANTSQPDTLAQTPFNIFIAHHQDASALVWDLRNKLKQLPNGNQYDITLSENVGNNPRPRIREADIFILVFSGSVDDMQLRLWRYAIVLGKRIIPILYKTTLAIFAENDFVSHHNLDKAVNNPIVIHTPTISDGDIYRLREQMRGKTYIASVDDVPSQTHNYRPIPRIFGGLKARILDNCRFINIIGNGDNGKSRLAIELAGCYIIRNRFTDGICWIDFKKLKRSDMLWKKLAQFFEASLPDPRRYADYIADKTRDKQYLFILDSYTATIAQQRFVSAFQSLGTESCLIVISREKVHHRNMDILFDEHPMSLLEPEKLALLAKELGTTVEALPDVAREIIKKTSSSFHIIKIANFIKNKLNTDENREKGYTLSNLEIWEEINRDNNFFRDMVKRDFGHLDPVYQEQFKKLVIFNHGDDIPHSALEALWQVEADIFKDYIYQLTKLKYISTNEDGTYRFVSSFLDYLDHRETIRQRSAIVGYHQALLTGYYPESIFKNIHDNWHLKVHKDRYLSEWLPYHLVEAQKADILFRILTTSDNWVKYRLDTNIHYLKDDLDTAKEAYHHDVLKKIALMTIEHWINDRINNQDVLELVMDVLFNPTVSLDSVIQRILFPKTPTTANPIQQVENVLAICAVEGAKAFTERYIRQFDDLISQINDPKKAVEFKLYLAKAIHNNPDFTPAQKSELLKLMISHTHINSDGAYHLKILCADDLTAEVCEYLAHIQSMTHYSEAITHITQSYDDFSLSEYVDDLIGTAKKNPVKQAYVLLALGLEGAFKPVYDSLISQPQPSSSDLHGLCYLAHQFIDKNYQGDADILLGYVYRHSQGLDRNDSNHIPISEKLAHLFAIHGDAHKTILLCKHLNKNKKIDCLVEAYTSAHTDPADQQTLEDEMKRLIDEDTGYESLQDKWRRLVVIGFARKNRVKTKSAYDIMIDRYRDQIKDTKPEAWYLLRLLVLELIRHDHEALARNVLKQVNALPNDVLAELMIDLTCIGKTDTARTFIESFRGEGHEEYRDKIHVVIETLDALRNQRIKIDDAIRPLASLFHRQYDPEATSKRETAELFRVVNTDEPSLVSKKLGRWLAYEIGIEAYRYELTRGATDYHEVALRILPDTNTFLHRIDMMRRVLARGDRDVADKIHGYMTNAQNRNQYFLESRTLIAEFDERQHKQALTLLDYLHTKSSNMRDFVAEVVRHYPQLGIDTPKAFIGELARLMSWADVASPFWRGLGGLG